MRQRKFYTLPHTLMLTKEDEQNEGKVTNIKALLR